MCFDSNEDGKDINGDDDDDVGSGQEEDENYDDWQESRSQEGTLMFDRSVTRSYIR